MNLQECSQKLLEVIGRINRHSEDIQKALDGQSEIILLVGDTGAGKSTIFNMLCGAEYEIKKIGLRDVLQIKDGTINYSLMKYGTQSVTSAPIYYFNQQYNHLIIDFPGFKDTKGEIEEMVIQLLFNKIVTKNKIKLVYVLQQPLVDLPNRGTFIHEFLSLFQNQAFRFSDCFLIMNSFTQYEIDEKSLIQNEKQQLKSITNDPNQDNQNMFVIRNIETKNINSLPQIKQELWNQLGHAKKVQFQSLPINKVEILSKYLNKTSRKFIEVIVQFFQTVVQDSLSTHSNEDLIKLQVILQSFKLDNQPATYHYQRLFQIYQELTIFFRTQNNIPANLTQGFLKIFEYFEGYKTYIDGYEQCAEGLKQVFDHTKLLDKQISLKIQQQKLQEDQNRQLKQLSNEFQQKYLDMIKDTDQKIEEVRKQERQLKDEEIAQFKQQNDEKLQAIQQQMSQHQDVRLEQSQGEQPRLQFDTQNIWEFAIQMAAVFIPLIKKKLFE